MTAMRALALSRDPEIEQPGAGPAAGAPRLALVLRLPAAAPRPAGAPRPARDPRAAAPANAPLRLTRRGRVVAAIAAALLAAGLSLLAAGAAQATSHSAASRTAGQDLAQVVVRPGQNLWEVAESADPQADTRVVIQQILELNSLTGDVIQAGQRLWVPRG